MENEVQQRFSEMPDSDLLDICGRFRDEYTESALAIAKAELRKRGIDADTAVAKDASQTEARGPQYARDDFAPLDHAFTQVDILLAQLALREHGIPFYVQLPGSASSAMPLDNIAFQSYLIHVPRELLEKARGVVEEHFSGSDGRYSRKEAGTREQLRSFSFNEVHLEEKDALEEVGVEFHGEELRHILLYVNRLIGEIEEVERKLERGLFYFDGLEELAERMAGDDGGALTRTDLLATLEVLQVYCDTPDFPLCLDTVAGEILKFLSA